MAGEVSDNWGFLTQSYGLEAGNNDRFSSEMEKKKRVSTRGHAVLGLA